jgi:hypothetical protein
MTNPNNPASVPTVAFFPWSDQWSPADWVLWHKALLRVFGLDGANFRFLSAWNEAGDLAPLSARTFDTNFRAYAKANGFFDGLFSGIGGVIAKPLGVVTDTSNAVASAGSNIAQGVSNSGSVVKYALPVLVIGLIAFYAYPYFKRIK